MAKEKKRGKRLTKNKLAEMLQDLFLRNPDKTLSFKQIFKELRLATHPAKMLAVETVEDMAWDDFLSKVSDNSYKLNLKGQVQEGKFIRKPNGKNSFVPDDGSQPVFVAERNSKSALTGDRVRVTWAEGQKSVRPEAIVRLVMEHRDRIRLQPPATLELSLEPGRTPAEKLDEARTLLGSLKTEQKSACEQGPAEEISSRKSACRNVASVKKTGYKQTS